MCVRVLNESSKCIIELGYFDSRSLCTKPIPCYEVPNFFGTKHFKDKNVNYSIIFYVENSSILLINAILKINTKDM